MSNYPEPGPSSLLSTSSVNHVPRSHHHSTLPMAINTVITSPPWARDEPPSPKDQTSAIPKGPHHTSITDIASYQSEYPGPVFSRWWAFTHIRTRAQPLVSAVQSPAKSEKKGLSLKDRSMSWLPTSTIRETPSFSRRDRGSTGFEISPTNDWDLTVPLPPPLVPFTLPHNMTPGWEIPWTARMPEQGVLASQYPYSMERRSSEFRGDDSSKNTSVWHSRRRCFRLFILSNTYVPLLFRFINITLTSATLAMAIRIRLSEMRNNVLGVVGSSTTLVIVFAPLTLLHVMAAIYLEYFGRPLGLWRTSAKLAHTLSEVLFICAWSAALSLCFDNFFTALVPCASESTISWYNKIPRSQTPVPNLDQHEGASICHDQLALICLVGVGLLMYCSNLIISLFRIFEKVKYHPVTFWRP